MILLLQNPVRHYAWGSHQAIPELLGQPFPSPRPYAELWISAHPAASSQVIVDHRAVPLCKLIASEPETYLGTKVVQRFGPRLPFLLKVLAADSPLSLQAHPSLAQAERGFSREQAAGIAVDASHRNYRDQNHKPEILCALEPFSALCGFRELSELGGLFDALGSTAGRDLWRSANAANTTERRKALLSALLRLDQVRARELVEATVRLAEQALSDTRFNVLDRESAALVLELSRLYPGDVGIVTALLLERVELTPGQALFLGPGQLHSYLRGVGVELMASSDNVLRAGLTVKHIDVEELLAVLDFTNNDQARVAHHDPRPGETLYPVPVDDFELRRLTVATTLDCQVFGPELLLCTSGAANVSTWGGDTFVLSRGQAAFVAASAEAYRLEGTSVIYRATVREAAFS